MATIYPKRSEYGYDDDGYDDSDYDEDRYDDDGDGYDDTIVILIVYLHSFLHAHCLSPVCIYIYQSV